jgi:DUF1009 family protein
VSVAAPAPDSLGLIAGNGRFPFLLLEAARAQGLRVVVAAIKEETDPEMDERARLDDQVRVHWMSLGELSRLIEMFQREGITRAVMAGQVKHKQIFSSIRPDWRLAKLLLNLRTRNTDMLLGAVAKVLEDEGITLISSTAYLEPMLAPEGVLTQRQPDETELGDIEYGLRVARGIAGFDLGQTAASTLQRRLTVVKVAKPKQDLRFDVPVVGVPTIAAMIAAGATCLCVEAGRTLLFDREAMVSAAEAAGIAIVSKR